MRRHISELVKLWAGFTRPRGPIYEFGSLLVDESKAEMCNFRQHFPGQQYVGCDITDGKNVDRILDICDTKLSTGSVGAVIAVEMLEHVRYPWKAAAEVRRILRNDGAAVFSSAMAFDIHHMPDYWRFTPAGFAALFEDFPVAHVDWSGKRMAPHTVVAYCWMGTPPDGLSDFLRSTEEWMRKE